MSEENVQRKLAAIFHADVAGYSRLMQEDEWSTVNTISEYRKIMSGLIRQHRGRVIDTSGDNVLAEFSSVVDAMQGAVSIQKELRARSADQPENRRMQFRIGINIGDVIQEGDRIYGDGVNIAARLESLAEPGGICISRMAYDQIENKLPLGYEYLGERPLKNIVKPLHVYRVVIEPDRFGQAGETGQAASRGPRPDPGQRSDADHRAPSLGKVKSSLKDFARDMQADEQVGMAFEEVKGRLRTFADDISGDKQRRRKALRELIRSRHVSVVLFVAAALFLLNAMTSFGTWWFPYPLAAIGLAVYMHWLKVSFLSPEHTDRMRRRMVAKDLAGLEEGLRTDSGKMKKARRRADARVRFYGHLYIYTGVNVFLAAINLLTSPFDWWFPFPLLGWGIALFLHWLTLR